MKKIIFILFYGVASLEVFAGNFAFKERDVMSLTREAVTRYNKNLRTDLFSKHSKNIPFSDEFKSHLKSAKIKQLWKADILGDRVYFKKGKEMFSMKVVEVKTISLIQLEINGKLITYSPSNKLKKTYDILKSTINKKSVSFWNLVLPFAYADEKVFIPESLDEAMSSAVGFLSMFTSVLKDEGDITKEKICALNENEKSNYTPVIGSDSLLKEVKYLVKIQNKYVKPNMKDWVVSDGNVCRQKCTEAKEFQKCINEVAIRRKNAIDKKRINGFSCFTRYEEGFTYLSSSILNQPLESYENSFEVQLEKIEKDKKFVCGTKIRDSERKSCHKKMAKRRANLLASCPQDANSLSSSKKQDSSSGGVSSR